MKIEDAFKNVTQVFIDTAPVIYYVEKDIHYFDIARRVFDWMDQQAIWAFSSPVTLAECLVLPLRQGLVQAQQAFYNFLVNNRNVQFEPIEVLTGREAAKIRSKYHLSLPDALQVAVALQTNCEALLTNDLAFKRISELRIVLLSELEP
jgi:predicted nucleic acid-binding protein